MRALILLLLVLCVPAIAEDAARKPADGAGDYTSGDNWRSSNEYGGSPGAPGTGPVVDIVVHEVLSHTDDPHVDAIELHNTTGATIDISGWYLSDSWGWASDPGNGDYKKFRIPNDTTIHGGGHLKFDESDFNASGGVAPTDFSLDGAHGDDVWLMEADADGDLVRCADHVEVGDEGEEISSYSYNYNGSGSRVVSTSINFYKMLSGYDAGDPGSW